jgi:hypothetical protein
VIAEDRQRNFGYGRTLRALDFADAKLACAEVERGSLPARVGLYG